MSDSHNLMRYDAMKKSTKTAYLLWYFTGLFGGHRFYVGRTGSAVAMLVISLISLPLMFFFVGCFTIFIPGIWAAVDLFFISQWIQDYNLRLADQMGAAAA